MAFRLVYTKTAVKDIKKLDSVVKKKIAKKILEYSKNPLHFSKKLTDARLGTFRWRIGVYRVVFDLDGANIVILRLGHRREIYR